MPIIENSSRDRVADALEELCEKLEEQLTSDVPPPVVNVSTPPATSPAPIVNVSAPSRPAHSWIFTVSRDENDRITTITVDPK